MAAVELLKRQQLRNIKMQGRRVFWHPYVNDEPSIWVDITGLWGFALLKATRLSASMADAALIEDAGKNGRVFNDPRLGCLRYSQN
jgi:hypothetical protein